MAPAPTSTLAKPMRWFLMQSKYPNIIYRQGDLLSAYQDGITVIGHQCNCLGVWNGGLHRQIGRRFPEVIRQYLAHQWKLGDMRIFDTHIPNFRIAYLAGQYDYGNSQKTGKVYTRLHTLCAAMEKLAKTLSPADRLAFPHDTHGNPFPVLDATSKTVE